ncbi:MAG: hypothetical protein IKS92_01070 [Victivallales bacterium]|nr:hypothetical protein [Victivallales bacterium]
MRFVVKKMILGEYVDEFCCFGRIKHVLSLAEKECGMLGERKTLMKLPPVVSSMIISFGKGMKLNLPSKIEVAKIIRNLLKS